MLSIKFGYFLPAALALALAAATLAADIGSDFFFGFGVSQTGLLIVLHFYVAIRDRCQTANAVSLNLLSYDLAVTFAFVKATVTALYALFRIFIFRWALVVYVDACSFLSPKPAILVGNSA